MLSVVCKRAVWLTAVLLFVAASGCSPEKQGQDSFPTSSTADSSEAGTIPASEEEEPSLVFLLPSSNVYKETEDPSVIARVIQRLQVEPRCPLQETVPVLIPPLRLECSDWPADLLITEEYLTEESPGGVQRTYRITPDLLDDLLALYASLETQEQLHGPTSELTMPALNGEGTLTVQKNGPGLARTTSDPALISRAAQIIAEGLCEKSAAPAENTNGTTLTLKNREWGGTVTVGVYLEYRPNGSDECVYYRLDSSVLADLLTLYEQMEEP